MRLVASAAEFPGAACPVTAWIIYLIIACCAGVKISAASDSGAVAIAGGNLEVRQSGERDENGNGAAGAEQ